jgi:predicted dehydrogenase
MAASMMEAGRFFESSLRVFGSLGTMSVVNPLAPQRGSSLDVSIGSDIVTHEVATTATYRHQLEAFRDAVEHGAPFPTTLEAGWEMMQLIDDCYRAAGLEPRPADPVP